MIFHCLATTLIGLDAKLIHIEVSASKGIPSETLVGLADSATKESKSRIKSAILQSGFHYPLLNYTINLAPAHLKKNGAILDVAIALGLLAATKQFKIPEKSIFLGELSLDGKLKSISSALAIVSSLQKQFPQYNLYLPAENKHNLALLKQDYIHYFNSLSDLVHKKPNTNPIKQVNTNCKKHPQASYDFADLYGLESIKQALLIALLGKHNCLLIGPPGCGKSQLLKCIASAINPLTVNEQIDYLRILSLNGQEKTDQTCFPPIRSPHHTISYAGMFGGGRPIKAGEVSLAHLGVLILDEIAEFKRDILEGLRQPLEDKHIHISRVDQSLCLPANCQVLASMNPCPCGFYGSQDELCSCSSYARSNYIKRLSGPLLDRFDMILDVAKLNFKEDFIEKKYDTLDSTTFKNHLTAAINTKRPNEAFQTIMLNHQDIITKLLDKKKLSFRSLKHILRLATSIAQFKKAPSVEKIHLLEALQYRKSKLLDIQTVCCWCFCCWCCCC